MLQKLRRRAKPRCPGQGVARLLDAENVDQATYGLSKRNYRDENNDAKQNAITLLRQLILLADGYFLSVFGHPIGGGRL